MNNTSPLGAIRRRWWIVVLMAVAGAGLAALPQPEKVEAEIVRTFDATHTLILNANTSEQATGTAVSPNQVSLFATTGVVPERAAEAVDFDGNAATLASTVIATFDQSTGALRISTTQPTADEAELIADTFAFELTSYLAERQDELYQDRLAASLDRLAGLEDELQGLTQSLAFEPENPVLAAQQSAVARRYSVAFEQNEQLEGSPAVLGFTTLQEAQAVETTDRGGLSAPTTRSSRALMGALVGAALGAGLAVALGQLDRKIRTREQAELVMDMRSRVMIPKVRDNDRDHLVVTKGRHEPLADSYRTVRNVVGFVQGPSTNDLGRITLVVSPGPGDGKTSLAANLAAAMAENGQRTILINTDFRRPRLQAAVRDEPFTPLPFTIDDLEAIEPRSLLDKCGVPNLLIMDLSSIDGTPGELVRATVAKLPQLREIADSIVIDTSPVGGTAEVLELVPHADVITIVARVGHTAIAATQRTMAILRDLATAPMVLVLGGEKPQRAQYYEYTNRSRDHEADDEPSGRMKFGRKKSKPNADRELEPVE